MIEYSTWYWEYSTWYWEYSPWYWEYSPWSWEYSTWSWEYSTWYWEYSVWIHLIHSLRRELPELVDQELRVVPGQGAQKFLLLLPAEVTDVESVLVERQQVADVELEVELLHHGDTFEFLGLFLLRSGQHVLDGGRHVGGWAQQRTRGLLRKYFRVTYAPCGSTPRLLHTAALLFYHLCCKWM